MDKKWKIGSAALAGFLCLLLILFAASAPFAQKNPPIKVVNVKPRTPGVYRVAGNLKVPPGSFKQFTFKFVGSGNQDLIVRYIFSDLVPQKHKKWSSTVALYFPSLPKIYAYTLYPAQKLIYGADFRSSSKTKYNAGKHVTLTMKLIRNQKLVKLSLNGKLIRQFNYRGTLRGQDCVVRVIGANCRLVCQAMTPAAGSVFTKLWRQY
ncbi:MAG: hypothetical protein K9K65_10045 [Desulfarculaceae bacterium]|nr:hypothetical protein [Desulfarculaceae bacterium]MCF8048820.1 hypothetical protein [Desulfarculaceae bacterium]MCF8064538.1 hypothetical protein [Desulfarculaceae bacterium]MCF8098171.1 hypothetical protein [Desulfarculaceae bacterium]MCF8121967.1 hypothetical protein [Desulfarculaceae bacterium]